MTLRQIIQKVVSHGLSSLTESERVIYDEYIQAIIDDNEVYNEINTTCLQHSICN